MSKHLSVVIPFFNEERNITSVALELYEELSGAGIDFELILVNNGSTDSTPAICDSLAKRYERIRAVHVLRNIGYGNGILTGIKNASGAYICYSDGDGQIPPEYVLKIYSAAVNTKADLVKARRIARESVIRRNLSSAYNIIVSLMFLSRVNDINAKPSMPNQNLITRQCFERLKIKSKDWFIDTEIVRESRVLITGASGFIGSVLVRRLLRDGSDVYVVCRSISTVKNPRLVDIWDSITVLEGNLCDLRSLKASVDACEPDIIYHLGAYTHVGRSFDHVEENFQTNATGTVNLLDALANTEFDSFVYMSTSEVYGPQKPPFKEDTKPIPVSPYSISKYSGELFCGMCIDAFDYPIVILRLFNAYGPYQSPNRVIPEAIVSCLRGEDFKMTEGKQTREFNYVEDLVQGMIKASIIRKARGEIINLGTGKDHRIIDVVNKIIEMMGNPIKPLPGALEHRPLEIWRMAADNKKAGDILGWKPTHTLEEGLRKTIEWYKDIYEKDPNAIYL